MFIWKKYVLSNFQLVVQLSTIKIVDFSRPQSAFFTKGTSAAELTTRNKKHGSRHAEIYDCAWAHKQKLRHHVLSLSNGGVYFVSIGPKNMKIGKKCLANSFNIFFYRVWLETIILAEFELKNCPRSNGQTSKSSSESLIGEKNFIFLDFSLIFSIPQKWFMLSRFAPPVVVVYIYYVYSKYILYIVYILII